MIVIALISCFVARKTRLTATLITFIAPVELCALLAQCYLAYMTEGIFGLSCIDDNGDEARILPILFWITLFVIFLLYALNVWFTIEMCCNKKLKQDERFQAYKTKYKNVFCVFHTVCLLVSFKMCAMLYSFFLGRKRYLAEFSRKRNYFKITNCLNLTFIVFGSTLMFLANLSGMAFYTYGTQFYISMIDTTAVVTVMAILQIIDFKHAKAAIERDKLVRLGYGVEEDSESEVEVPPPPSERKKKRKQQFAEQLDNSQRGLLKQS